MFHHIRCIWERKLLNVCSFTDQQEQTDLSAQLRILWLSWKWLRKWEAARTWNIFPALPPGQHFQTYRGSDKDKTFSINFDDAFLQRAFFHFIVSERFHDYPPPPPTCVDKDWTKKCLNRYTASVTRTGAKKQNKIPAQLTDIWGFPSLQKPPWGSFLYDCCLKGCKNKIIEVLGRNEVLHQSWDNETGRWLTAVNCVNRFLTSVCAFHAFCHKVCSQVYL